MSNAMANSIMAMAANVALSEIGAGPEITGFSDRDEARAAFAALVDNAANAPADPALLALATFAAEIVKGIWREGSGFDSDDDGWFDELGRLHGITGDHDPELAPGIADAIAALLAPDGADGAGEVTP